MDNLINLKEYPVINVLDKLLKDKTTKKNIIFATDSYDTSEYGFKFDNYITKEVLFSLNCCEIQPRVTKTIQQQFNRTKQKAEVFTPAWICNKMNNNCDNEWFGKENVFNYEDNHSWITNNEKIEFKDKTWKKYVDSPRLEITCGEAPYIVSRYDSSTGNIINVENRIGILDRKIRVINENAKDEKEWLKYVYIAYKSVYGYEYQGDNLLIARINLLNSFIDYMEYKWNKQPNKEELYKITNIIVWNFWQMDGLNFVIPFKNENQKLIQCSIFDEENIQEVDINYCKIYDWKKKKKIDFIKLKGNEKDEI